MWIFKSRSLTHSALLTAGQRLGFLEHDRHFGPHFWVTDGRQDHQSRTLGTFCQQTGGLPALQTPQLQAWQTVWWVHWSTSLCLGLWQGTPGSGSPTLSMGALYCFLSASISSPENRDLTIKPATTDYCKYEMRPLVSAIKSLCSYFYYYLPSVINITLLCCPEQSFRSQAREKLKGSSS